MFFREKKINDNERRLFIYARELKHLKTRNPFYLLENQITKFLLKSTGEYWIDKLRIFFPLPLVALSGFPWSSTFTSLLTLHPMSASFPFLASLAAPKLHRPRATTLRVRQSMRQDVLSCFISCWICAPRITN